MTLPLLAFRIALSAAASAGLAVAAPALAQTPGPATGFTPGQNTVLTAPKLPTPAQAPAAQALPPSGPAPETGDDAVLIPRLEGLRFVNGPGALQAGGVTAGQGEIATPGLPLLADPAFAAQMKPFLGKPLTQAGLQQIRDRAKAWYVARKRPFIDVVAPPQTVDSGVLQVVVSEYRLAGVEVVGAHYFSPQLIARAVDLKPGQTIGLDRLQGDIDRLNENPFLSVDAQFVPTAEPGATQMVLHAKDRLPVRVYAGYDNQGLPALDRDEWNLGINWGNVFGTGQIAAYQLTRAWNGRFTSHSVSDLATLDANDKILVFGAYAQLRGVADLFGLPLESAGHAAQASVRLVHTLPRWQGLTGHIQLGYDYKYTDTDAQFGEVQLGAPTPMETHQFPVIYDGAETDRFGSTTLENDFVYAPGRLSARDTDAAFQALVAGSRAAYVYDRFQAARTERLPDGLSLVARAVVQRSNAILPNSEQLGGGGVGSVRGYFPDTALGSNGVLAAAELRAPAFSPQQVLHLGRAGDSLQLGVFYDYASLSQPYYPTVTTLDAGAGTRPVDLASTGGLAHYSVGRFVDLNLDFGVQLRRAPDQAHVGSYAAIALVFSN